jgi:hypothetical protein
MTGAHYRLVYEAVSAGNTQAGGAFEVSADANALTHQISTTKDGGTTGTLAVQVKPLGSDRYENLTIDGSAVQLDLSADQTFGPFDACIESFQFTPTAFDGTDFAVSVAGW